jgi:hypothetical protein
MIKKYTVLISLLLISSVYGQIVFEKTYGTIDNDGGYSIHICSDNSYVITGYTSNFYTGYKEIYIVKINELGDTLWTRSDGDINNEDYGLSVFETENGSYIVSGQMVYDNSYVPFLLKYNENGQKLWMNNYAEYITYGAAYNIIQTNDLNYVFGGRVQYSKSMNGLWTDKGYLIKTNQDGEVIWMHDYGTNTGNEYLNDFIETSDNGFAICGSRDIQWNNYNAWIIKTHEDGSLAWDNNFGEADYREYANDIKQTADGGYIICGSSFWGAGHATLFVAKTNSIGVEEWNKKYDFGEEAETRGTAISFAEDGGYFVCATQNDYVGANTDVLLIKIDDTGDTIWTKLYGGAYDEMVWDMHTTNDGGVIMCGTTRSFGFGGLDIYVIKTNQDGLITNTNDIDYSLSKIQIYPNPSSNIFTIKADEEIVSFKIFNMQGVLIKQNDAGIRNGSYLQIDLSPFASGVYYGVFETNNAYQTKKIIKQ